MSDDLSSIWTADDEVLHCHLHDGDWLWCWGGKCGDHVLPGGEWAWWVPEGWMP